MNSGPSKLLLAGIVIVLAAARTSTAHAHPFIDPCTSLTPAEVKAIFGVKVGAGVAIGTHGCSWTATEKLDGKMPTVTVVLKDGGEYAGMKSSLPGIPQTALSGVGDDAFYDDFGALFSLGVKKGNVAFIVRLYGVADKNTQKAMEKAVALDVVAKL